METKLKKALLATALLSQLNTSLAYSIGVDFQITNNTGNVIYANGMPVLSGEQNKKTVGLPVQVDFHNVSTFERDVDLFFMRGERICRVSAFATTMPTGLLWPTITSAYSNSDHPDKCSMKINIDNPRTVGEPKIHAEITVH